MGRTDVATLVFPLIGLWLLIEGVSGLVGPLWRAMDESRQGSPWLVTVLLLPALVSVASAGLLLLRPHQLARRLFADEPAAEPPAAARDWQALGVSLIGVTLLAIAIPGLFGAVATFAIAAAAWNDVGGSFDITATIMVARPDWGPILEALTQALLGAYLFAAARGISGFWSALTPDDVTRALKRLGPAAAVLAMAAVTVWMLSASGPN